MQLISVYLYPNKIDVFTNTLAAWQPERYRRVYNRNLKIHRGVDNRVDLQVRNSDQKAQDITGSYLVFNLVNRESKELILQKDCVIQTASSGKSYVILSNAELADIEPGFYQYSIHTETRTVIGDTHTITAKNPLYIDSQYGAFSPLEIYGDIAGEPVDSVVIKEFKNYQPYDPNTRLYVISGIIDAQPQYGTPQSLHTFQIKTTNYQGDIIIQGSQSEGGNPEHWVDLETIATSQDPILYQNITGKYNWFRIKHIPALLNTGTVDSILYR
jgi:hypothetical protein